MISFFARADIAIVRKIFILISSTSSRSITLYKCNSFASRNFYLALGSPQPTFQLPRLFLHYSTRAANQLMTLFLSQTNFTTHEYQNRTEIYERFSKWHSSENKLAVRYGNVFCWKQQGNCPEKSNPWTDVSFFFFFFCTFNKSLMCSNYYYEWKSQEIQVFIPYWIPSLGYTPLDLLRFSSSLGAWRFLVCSDALLITWKLLIVFWFSYTLIVQNLIHWISCKYY